MTKVITTAWMVFGFIELAIAVAAVKLDMPQVMIAAGIVGVAGFIALGIVTHTAIERRID